jgi:hypothetical protein
MATETMVLPPSRIALRVANIASLHVGSQRREGLLATQVTLLDQASQGRDSTQHARSVQQGEITQPLVALNKIAIHHEGSLPLLSFR